MIVTSDYMTILKIDYSGRISYDINIPRWSEDKPCLFFHPEGDTGVNLVGFLSIGEDEAIAIVNRHNG
jgi:hypothetical protein